MLPSVTRLLEEEVTRQQRVLSRRNRIGPGRVTLHTWHRAAAKGKNWAALARKRKEEMP